MNIKNDKGQELKKVLKDNNVSTYRGTCVKDFPNLVSLGAPPLPLALALT